MIVAQTGRRDWISEAERFFSRELPRDRSSVERLVMLSTATHRLLLATWQSGQDLGNRRLGARGRDLLTNPQDPYDGAPRCHQAGQVSLRRIDRQDGQGHSDTGLAHVASNRPLAVVERTSPSAHLPHGCDVARPGLLTAIGALGSLNHARPT